ncbi:MAG TPA: hypothetical protein VM146_16795 [Steroidobacteraceae bacterium]|nr:hypothetical protein [Steroidobacteraceae bacterium]
MYSTIGKMPAQDGASPGTQRESMLGEWIGVSLERFLDVTGQRPGLGDGQAGVTVLATELQPRRPAVTIVTWRVYDAVSDTGARKVR